ncbi:DUF6783 domain-containing protein [Clostridium sp. MCC353]
MCVTVCGRFVPNEGDIAGCIDRIRDKFSVFIIYFTKQL